MLWRTVRRRVRNVQSPCHRIPPLQAYLTCRKPLLNASIWDAYLVTLYLAHNAAI
jgi:hypothetical protein